MSARLPLPFRITLAGLVASFALTGQPASAQAPRAKKAPARATKGKKKPPARAGKIPRHVVELGKAHIKPASRTVPSSGPGSVQPKDPGEVKFVLSANTPHFPYRGRIQGFYPREWRTWGDSLGPGGEIWLSQNQVPHGSYALVRLNVEPGFDYEVKLCTESGTKEMVRVTVGDVTHTFPAWTPDCDMTLVLHPESTGWTNIKLDFADSPDEGGANAYAIRRVEVVRRKS